MRGVTKAAVEVRRVGVWVVITYLVELPDELKILFSTSKPDPNSAQMILVREKIEQLIGIPNGKCRMF
jgi:hypothetical protein